VGGGAGGCEGGGRVWAGFFLCCCGVGVSGFWFGSKEKKGRTYHAQSIPLPGALAPNSLYQFPGPIMWGILLSLRVAFLFPNLILFFLVRR